MSYLSQEKSQLINLEYSLFKEILRTNRAGSYSSSSIIGCNTRKYHGLLVCPIPKFNMVRHVLLSSLDTSIVQHEKEFNLGLHKYSGNHYEPKGHKYIEELQFDIIPRTVYRVGGVLLSVENILVQQEEQVLLRYTLLEAHSETKLKLKPFIANRSVHSLTQANLGANTKYDKIPNGACFQMYPELPSINIQLSKENEFVPVPDWYFGIEYIKEQRRGYDYKEDLYVPGYFEVDIQKGESVIVSISTKQSETNFLNEKFKNEVEHRIPRNSFYNDLLNSATQFFVTNGEESTMVAGYHWYGKRLRDTLISLPALTEAIGNSDLFLEVTSSTIDEINEHCLGEQGCRLEQVDTPLWLFWLLQECWDVDVNIRLWAKYAAVFKQIIRSYINGKFTNVILQKDGLLRNNDEDKPLTWMDSLSEGKAVTQRNGLCVEVNALWYNALCYMIHAMNDDEVFRDELKALCEKLEVSFEKTFWNDKDQCLFDVVYDEDNIDSAIRPNQIFTTAFKFSPLNNEQKKSVIDVVRRELLTPKGIRTLSPQDPKYQGGIAGPELLREKQLHQGTVWPWLMAFYAEGYLRLHKKSGMPHIKNIIKDFENEMEYHCLGTLSEYFDANPPHRGKGAVSMAWNVAGVLKILKLIDNYS